MAFPLPLPSWFRKLPDMELTKPRRLCRGQSRLKTKLIAELRRPWAAKRSPILIWETKGNPWVDFLMVIMTSGIARGRVRMTTTTATTTVESRKMAAILQIIGWQRHATLVYCVLLWYWTSMLWSTDTCQTKISADQYHVTISRAQVYNSSRSCVFLKLTADQVLVFRLDRRLMSGQLVENRAGLFGSQLTLAQD